MCPRNTAAHPRTQLRQPRPGGCCLTSRPITGTQRTTPLSLAGLRRPRWSRLALTSFDTPSQGPWRPAAVTSRLHQAVTLPRRAVPGTDTRLAGNTRGQHFAGFLCWVNLEHYKTRTLCLSRYTFLRLVIFIRW